MNFTNYPQITFIGSWRLRFQSSFVKDSIVYSYVDGDKFLKLSAKKFCDYNWKVKAELIYEKFFKWLRNQAKTIRK